MREEDHSFTRLTDGIVRREAEERARAREARAVALVCPRLPPALRWLVRYPRILAVLYCLRPAWRPTLTE